MSNKAWDCLYLYFSTQEQHYLTIKSLIALDQLTDISGTVINAADINEADIENANSPDKGLVKSELTDILSIYQRTLTNIQQCRKSLAAILSEQEVKLVMQALIFHVDETVLTIKMASRLWQKKRFLWPGMQKELLQCRNGGEKFFINLNHLLKHSEDNRMALEVYYFCLKQGFKGCYFNDPEKIKQYCVQCTRAIKRNATLPPFSSRSTASQLYSADIILKGRKGLEDRNGTFAY